jgi:hypothetical protein
MLFRSGFAILWALCLLGARSPDTQTVPLGYGHETIAIPVDWKISQGKVLIELASYDIFRPGVTSPAIHLYVSGGTEHETFPGQTPYCSNGLRGHTATIGGMTHVVVLLPALSEDEPYDNAAGFAFKAGDHEAAVIVQSLRVQAYHHHC